MLPSAELPFLRAPYEAADVFLITTSANRLTARTSGASDLVGNHAGNRRQECQRNACRECRRKSDGWRKVQRFDRIGRHVDDEVVDRGGDRERADAQDHAKFLLQEDLPDRRVLFRSGRRRRILKMVADVDADRPEQNPEQERNPPPPTPASRQAPSTR